MVKAAIACSHMLSFAVLPATILLHFVSREHGDCNFMRICCQYSTPLFCLYNLSTSCLAVIASILIIQYNFFFCYVGFPKRCIITTYDFRSKLNKNVCVYLSSFYCIWLTSENPVNRPNRSIWMTCTFRYGEQTRSWLYRAFHNVSLWWMATRHSYFFKATPVLRYFNYFPCSLWDIVTFVRRKKLYKTTIVLHEIMLIYQLNFLLKVAMQVHTVSRSGQITVTSVEKLQW